MKFNIISYTFFLFVMVMFFPSLIYAPWTNSLPPLRPPSNLEKDCAGWIVFNGFTLKNYRLNRKKAETRDHALDKKASTWAAMYAFKIGGKKELYNIVPKQFCKNFAENTIPKKFVALEDEHRYCHDWITLYGFSEDNQDYNSTYAQNFHITEHGRFVAGNIALWAYLYFLMVKKHGQQYHLSPKEFCSKIGKNVEEKKVLMSFMCENDAYLTCKDWISLYEYSDDDPEYNYIKAVALNNVTLQYQIQIQGFPSLYDRHLIELSKAGQPRNVTPQEFCRSYDGDGAEPQEYNYERETRSHIVPTFVDL